MMVYDAVNAYRLRKRELERYLRGLFPNAAIEVTVRRSLQPVARGQTSRLTWFRAVDSNRATCSA